MASAAAKSHSPLGLFPDRPQPRLYDRVIEVLRLHHSSRIQRSGPRPWPLDSRPLNDIRTVQELSGHKDVRTTMVYTHALNKFGRGVKSPADFDDFVSG